MPKYSFLSRVLDESHEHEITWGNMRFQDGSAAAAFRVNAGLVAPRRRDCVSNIYAYEASEILLHAFIAHTS